uniref:DUF148 domain-containing protein n=1 Tax=Strongyloides stercoralis TaxID=6248 RepID=A0A0K0EE67_STRER
MKILILFVFNIIIYNIYAQENIAQVDGIDLSSFVPSFLINATDDAKEQYKNIVNNLSLSIGSIKQQIEDIINGQSDEVKAAYEEEKSKTEQIEGELRTNFTASRDNLPEDAKPYFDKILAIIENESLPLNQIPTEISKVSSEITDNNIKNEIAKYFPINLTQQELSSNGIQ